MRGFEGLGWVWSEEEDMLVSSEEGMLGQRFGLWGGSRRKGLLIEFNLFNIYGREFMEIRTEKILYKIYITKMYYYSLIDNDFLFRRKYNMYL